MADTVDRAEDAVDGRKQRVDARNGFAKAAVVVDQLCAEAAGDLAKMRHLAIAAADIEETAAIQLGAPRGGLLCLLIGLNADLPVRPLFRLSSHLPPVRSLIVTRFLRVRPGPY